MHVDLRTLISHDHSLPANMPLGEASRQFSHHPFEFVAVMDGSLLLGLCARIDIANLLGSQYGYSLFAQKPLREHLRQDPVCIRDDDDLVRVFERVFNREAARFFDDVLLIDANGAFLGLISTHTLVKLQNRIHQNNIRLLQQQQRVIMEKNMQMEQDLRMSRELQQALLTNRYPTFSNPRGAAASLQFHHVYHPVQAVGGDFFHIKKLSETTAGVFIADVMGHGVRAALITSMLRALLEEAEDDANDPGRLLEFINSELSNILIRAENGGFFATALYLTVDANTGIARYATAGHPPPLHLRRQHASAQILDNQCAGMVLGVFQSATYRTAECSLEPGDVVLLYTDGIVELESCMGEEYGIERCLREIQRMCQAPLPDLLARLVEQVRRHSDSGQFNDDVCLVAVEICSVTR